MKHFNIRKTGDPSLPPTRRLNRCGPHQNPSQLVGLGFRYWVKALQTQRTAYYDLSTKGFIQAFGTANGIVHATRLGDWVSALDHCKQRAFDVYDEDDLGFSHDEVLAISMVAASQHGNCPALRACLYAITPSSSLDYALKATDAFAAGLIDAGQIIDPAAIAEPLKAMTTQMPAYAN